MRIRFVLLIGLTFAVVALVGLTVVFPSIDDLWVENPFWNGLSEMYVALKPVRLGELSSLGDVAGDPGNSTVLMLGPAKPFTADEVMIVDAFLKSGGTVVLADDFGTGNTLLEGLGLRVRFSGELLQDPLFKDLNPVMPEVLTVSVALQGAGVSKLVLNYPTVLNNTEGLTVSASSSFFSYLSTAVAAPSTTSPSGPFPVVAEAKVGKGRLVLVSDPSPFINGMLGKAGNEALLGSFVRGQAVIDEAHSIPTNLALIKGFLAQVYAVANLVEVKYPLVALAVLLGFKVKWGEPVEDRVDEVEAVLRGHPEWDRGLIENVEELRRRSDGRR
jgi:hypothetical protein